MVALYVVSVGEATGKTAVCAGLAKNLVNDGKKVAYLKPAAKDGADAFFMKQALELTDENTGKDVVLIESAISPDTAAAAKEAKAKVVAVAAYPADPAKHKDAYNSFGDSLLGVVLNKVPQSLVKEVQEETAAALEKAGIKLLGVLPEDRTLFAISVGELADKIQGKILNNSDKSADLVENYMLGAMVVDSGRDYFARKSNKAAVIRQDRPDMQLAALETSMSCLVLSGGGESPIYSVMEKAQSRGIPVISTESNAGEIIAGIESAIAGSRLGQEKKLTKLAEVVRKSIDLSALI